MTTEAKSVKLPKVEASPKGEPKKKLSKEQLDQKNLENSKKELKEKAELMYAYPDEIETGEEKKKFRTAARRIKAKFLRQLAEVKTEEEAAEIRKEASKWARMTYTKSHMPSF